VSRQKDSASLSVNSHARYLAVSLRIDARNHQGRLADNAVMLAARLDIHRANFQIRDQKMERSRMALIEILHPRIQPDAKLADG